MSMFLKVCSRHASMLPTVSKVLRSCLITGELEPALFTDPRDHDEESRSLTTNLGIICNRADAQTTSAPHLPQAYTYVYPIPRIGHQFIRITILC